MPPIDMFAEMTLREASSVIVLVDEKSNGVGQEPEIQVANVSVIE